MSRIVSAIFLAAIAITLAMGAFAPASWQDALATDGPGCPFRTLTGVNCPFCGMTHATLAIGRGDFSAALGFHPLAPAVLLLFIGVLVAILARRTSKISPYVVLAVVIAIWIARLLLQK